MTAMTDVALRQLALDYEAGHVYSTADVPENMWRMVFMPILFMDAESRKKLEQEDIAHVYAHVVHDKTSGCGVNGYPTFYSCRFITKADWATLTAYREEVRTQRTAFLTPAPRP